MSDAFWRLQMGTGPLVAMAVHDGHALRDELRPYMALGDHERLREEDPFTGLWTEAAPTRVVALRSRFEVDFNRPREKAVYLRPEDAWGLHVWNTELPPDVQARSLVGHDAFFETMHSLFQGLVERHGRFVVFDLHSYNHRRESASGPPADPAGNPQINVGTGTMDRARWTPVVDRFLADLRACDFPGGPLDVRENVRFYGGYVPRWIHETFPETGCALAIEVKKFFMDEWTGVPDRTLLHAVGQALRAAVPGVLEALEALERSAK